MGGEVVGEVAALVVEGADGEAKLDEEDKGKLDKPMKTWMTTMMLMGAAGRAGSNVG